MKILNKVSGTFGRKYYDNDLAKLIDASTDYEDFLDRLEVFIGIWKIDPRRVPFR